ncbi:MAG: response regulator [Pseudomonadota bacterium]
MTKTVLIVEDNALNRRLFHEVLSDAGYLVLEVVDGESAIEHCLAAPPDLMLLDLGLPRLAGFEVVRRLRANPDFPRIPIIAVSAFVSGSDVQAALESGCDDHAPKPLRPEELRRLVLRHIGPATPGSED